MKMNIFKSFVSSVVVGSVLFINCADLSGSKHE